MNPRTVLAIDDDPVTCAFLSALLRAKGYRVVTETRPRRALRLLGESEFDVVLLDLVMPELDGLGLLKLIRDESAVPVIMVTGHASLEAAVEAMRLGASDFITKPVNGDVLEVRIQRALEHERARRLANTDGLTGLYNHRYFQDRLEVEIERAARYSRPLSLLIADLDHFKSFNDRFGHPVGDRVLVEVSRAMERSSRATDILARYGGEEFAVILTETAEQAARFVAHRLRGCVSDLRLEGLEEAQLTLSAGLGEFAGGSSRDAFVRRVDGALYRAKRTGRNRVCIARPDEQQGSPELPPSRAEAPSIG